MNHASSSRLRSLLLAIALCPVLASPWAFADETLALGATFAGQGCVDAAGVEATATIHAEYSRDGESTDVHAYVRDAPRGADCRENGLTIDIGLERQFDLSGDVYVAADFGYDEHGVTGFDAADRIVFGSVKQATAAVGVGYRLFGGEIDAGYNVANGLPRIAVEYGVGDFALAADYSGGYRTGSLVWQRTFAGSRLGVQAAFRHQAGFRHLPDPFGGRADAPAADKADVLEFSLTFTP